MIDEQTIDELVDALLKNSEKAGILRGERVKAEESLKIKRAVLAAHSNEKSEAAKDRCALCHEEYKEAVDELAKAVTEDEGNRAWRAGATMAIECWRTMEANRRSVKL